MGKTKGKAPADKRKPKHSNDGNRANKLAKDGMRDAATVRFSWLAPLELAQHFAL